MQKEGAKSTVKKNPSKQKPQQTINIQGLVAFASIITRQDIQLMPRQVQKNSTHPPRDYIYHSTF